MKKPTSDFAKKTEKILLNLAPFLAIAVFAFVFFANPMKAVWFDEAYSAALIKYNFADIWNLTSLDVHPPLYYFLLKIWSAIFGFGEIQLRSMSMFFGIVAILLAWRFVRYKFGYKSAAFAAILLALSPVILRYATEARMYTLVVAIVLAAGFVLEKALATRQKRYWILYAILLALGMWTHYFVALAWLAQLIYLATIFRKKIFQKEFYFIYGSAIILFLPWIPSLLSQTASVQSGFWIGPISVNTLAEFFTGSLASADPGAVGGWKFMLFSFVTVALIYFSIRFRKKLGQLIFLAWLPPLMMIILSLPPLQPMFVQRYLLYSAAALWLILAIGAGLFYQEFREKIRSYVAKKFTKIKSRSRQKNLANRLTKTAVCCAIFIFAGFLLLCYRNFADYNRQKSTSRQIIADISELDNQNLPILFANQDSIYNYYNYAFYETEKNPIFLYWPENKSAADSVEPALRNNKKRVKNLDEFFAKNRKFWYFLNTHDDYDAQDLGENLVEKKVVKKSTEGQDYQIILFEKVAKN